MTADEIIWAGMLQDAEEITKRISQQGEKNISLETMLFAIGLSVCEACNILSQIQEKLK